MFDLKALRHAMLDADCSAHDLAKSCEISPSAMYRRLHGKISFTLKEINLCTERLNLTTDQRDAIFFADEVS